MNRTGRDQAPGKPSEEQPAKPPEGGEHNQEHQDPVRDAEELNPDATPGTGMLPDPDDDDDMQPSG